jgi:hypothetical protein
MAPCTHPPSRSLHHPACRGGRPRPPPFRCRPGTRHRGNGRLHETVRAAASMNQLQISEADQCSRCQINTSRSHEPMDTDPRDHRLSRLTFLLPTTTISCRTPLPSCGPLVPEKHSSAASAASLPPSSRHSRNVDASELPDPETARSASHYTPSVLSSPAEPLNGGSGQRVLLDPSFDEIIFFRSLFVWRPRLGNKFCNSDA